MNLTLNFEPEMYNAIAKTAQIENVAIENYAERVLIEKIAKKLKGTSTKKETKIKKLTRKEINAMDTTDYLLSNPANKKFLLEAIEDAKDPSKGITMTFEEFING
ncbi:MAG: hypothetical protein Ta2D_05370 [Rickettsiales bacterium]|nr:MAG: hypothetical protein Ta2D_05370 [Rickettsiales bacterium]